MIIKKNYKDFYRFAESILSKSKEDKIVFLGIKKEQEINRFTNSSLKKSMTL